MNLVFAACGQLLVHGDPGNAQSAGRTAAGGIFVLLIKESSKVEFSYCHFVRSTPIQEPG